MRMLIIVLLAHLFVNLVNAKPEMIWAQTYGNNQRQGCSNTIQTNDGGYILVGSDDSNLQETWSDFYVVKTNEDGEEEWSRSFRGSRPDY
ncbi:MAG: hypothetical protein P9X24_11070, partial [Candidatus Hatepunaea meridiana]|nr:hypothetical protein [Candidatus Hatepunaea meridiana]